MKYLHRQRNHVIVCWMILSSVSVAQNLPKSKSFYLIQDNFEEEGREHFLSTEVNKYIYKNEEIVNIKHKMKPIDKRNEMTSLKSFNNIKEFAFTDGVLEHSTLIYERRRIRSNKNINEEINNFESKRFEPTEEAFVPYFRSVYKRDDSLPDCNLTQLMTYIADLQVVSPETIIKLANEKDIEAMCSKLDSSVKNIDTFLTTCKPPQEKELYMQLISGIRTLDSKICKDKVFLKEFISHVSCFSGLSEKYNACVGPSDWLEDPDAKEMCKTFNDIESCYVKATEGDCGHDGAELMKNLVRAVIESVITVDCKAVETTTAAAATTGEHPSSETTKGVGSPSTESNDSDSEGDDSDDEESSDEGNESDDEGKGEDDDYSSILDEDTDEDGTPINGTGVSDSGCDDKNYLFVLYHFLYAVFFAFYYCEYLT